MKILYLHGLGSSGTNSTSVRMLTEAVSDGVDVSALDYCPEDAHSAIQSVVREVKRYNPDVVVGTSMGGYWAMRLATYIPFFPTVIAINPVLDPTVTLSKYLRNGFNDYTTTPHTVKAMTPVMLSQFKAIDSKDIHNTENDDNYPAVFVYVGEKDDVVAPINTIHFLKDNGYSPPIFEISGMGHRLDHNGATVVAGFIDSMKEQIYG